MHPGRLQERLRSFEVQIRERDQIISRLKVDKLAAVSRYQVLVDAYKQLRRVSGQNIPSHRLPTDISMEIMKIVQEEKHQSKDESRPSMNEKDIKDQMATFIVEMEQAEDLRIEALSREKAALELSLEEAKKRLEQLQEETQSLQSEIVNRAFEIGQLSGSLRASESEMKRLELRLQQANAHVDIMNSNASTSNDKLFTTLKELGDAKATQASLENTVAQQARQLEEHQAKYDRTIGNLRIQLESKGNEVRALEQKLSQLAGSLRSSQDERERLAKELSDTAENLDKTVHENGSLAHKSHSVEEELGELKLKCEERKAKLLATEDRLSQEKNKSEELSNQLTKSRIELEEFRTKLHDQEVEAAAEKQILQNQLTQSRDNFERLLDEARRTHEILEGQRIEAEKELELAVNRMKTLENQVQKCDELFAEAQLEKDTLQSANSRLEAQNALLKGLMTGAEAEGAKAKETIRDFMAKEEEIRKELTDLKTQFVDMELLKDAKEAEIRTLELEVSALTEKNTEIEESLQRAVNETVAEREKLRAQNRLKNNFEQDKEEQAKLRSEVDAMRKKMSHRENQLRIGKENR